MKTVDDLQKAISEHEPTAVIFLRDGILYSQALSGEVLAIMDEIPGPSLVPQAETT